jgi:hypothetical protein
MHSIEMDDEAFLSTGQFLLQGIQFLRNTTRTLHLRGLKVRACQQLWSDHAGTTHRKERDVWILRGSRNKLAEAHWQDDCFWEISDGTSARDAIQYMAF